jgi:integrase
VARCGPGECCGERKAHADQERWESSVWRAEDQQEPPVYLPHSTGRERPENASGAPATGHGDLGDRYQDQGLIFTTDTGAPINPSNLRQRSFAPLLKRAGLPHMRFHDLRHTCATLLLSRGVHPKFVQELLGHATIAITLDTYSHVMPSMGDATARAMEDALA